MTIEGRPELQGAQEYWDKEYARQRKDRMQDCIDDYLQDQHVDARQAYEEMLSCIDDVIEYHRCALEKASTLKDLMMGHRSFPEWPGEDPELAKKWQYDKIPDRF
jgi:hypothetical protein